MTEPTWTDLLLQQSLLFSAAVLLLALLRPLLRRLLDAGAVYLAWLLVPLLMLSPWMPRLLQGQVLPASMLSLEQAVPAWLMPAMTAVAPMPAKPVRRPDTDAEARYRSAPQVLALGIWSSGAAALLAHLAWRQRRFSGRLKRAGAAWIAPAGESPALLGLWRTRLVLPQDFEQRFSPQEQALILAHEAVHARRHDNDWNLLAAGLLVLQWFNPLAWWALRRMRQDQELACDAAVLNQQRPVDSGEEPFVKTYINALLKSHPGRGLPVLSTGWAHRHPLLERVNGLRLHRRPAWQRSLGRSSALGLCLGLTVLAQAAQPMSGADATEQLTQFLIREEAISGKPPTGVIVQMDSQQGQETWKRKDMAAALAHTLNYAQSEVRMVAPMGDWCLSVQLQRMPGGELRTQGEVMDRECRRSLTGLQAIQPGKGPTNLLARLPGSPQQVLQAQVSVRFEDPRSEGFVALYKRQVEELPASAHADIVVRLTQLRKIQTEHQAQDKAWRQARGDQP